MGWNMSSIRKGSKVSYKVGRGYGEATVLEIKDGVATLQTSKGGNLNRAVDDLTLLGKTAAPAKKVKASDDSE